VGGRVESINASRGGVPKQSMSEALITEAGLDGDRQRDLRFHGGPDRASSSSHPM
jgi:MOSC domain-containing protein YiiM